MVVRIKNHLVDLSVWAMKTRFWWVVGGVVLAWVLGAWVAATVLVVRAQVKTPEVIVVLSGSEAYVERTRCAAQIFRSVPNSRVVLTNDGRKGGWLQHEQRNPYYYERAQIKLMELGVPVASIDVLPQAVHSTYEEAIVIRDYLITNQFKSLAVITSSFHSRRALWTFEKVLEDQSVTVGLEPGCGVRDPPALYWWIYSRGWREVPIEYIKIVYYRWNY